MKNNALSNDEIYDNNLYFYTILKKIVQCNFTAKQLLDFQEMLHLLENHKNNHTRLKDILYSSQIIKSETKKKDYDGLISLIGNDSKMWFDMVSVGIELILFKDLILAEAKAYTQNRRFILGKLDKLSIEYDSKNLSLPYGQKVLSSLLCFALTNTERKSEFLLTASNQIVKNINMQISKLTHIYQIHCNNMFLLIVNESVSQSIKSTAGHSYESRIELTLMPIVDKLLGRSHKVQAMEYDFIFIIKDKKVGISAKRTLRERYKQNHENIDDLSVDALFLFTLGTDLNKDKVNSILQKDGYFIVVASEIYDTSDFMQENPKIISSKDLTRKKLENILA
ncbi:hypothetical protein BKH46_05175 [Helicobacter sp. 12S02634-8]|uniref:hypothetical protein n=1 Tax=Helicobacter sp. 12S02634-8 TaxID=1476199 RepID=UPI000BA65C2D|nr:hypothetical protein [Helicobacter sp. 12S02634-8]PAF47105.1 hypothetical protein BKH46_05175 [Helicobacter sp. 12S02634-8]